MKKLSTAIKEVYGRLMALSQEELINELNKHKKGDIANFIVETKVLEVGEYKAKIYSDYTFIPAVEIGESIETAPAFFDGIKINFGGVVASPALDLFTRDASNVQSINRSCYKWDYKSTSMPVITNDLFMSLRDAYVTNENEFDYRSVFIGSNLSFSLSNLCSAVNIEVNTEEILELAA